MDFVEDSLWIRMELMERSVADAIALVEEGIDLNEKIMAQVARDVRSFLGYQRKMLAYMDYTLVRPWMRSSTFSQRGLRIEMSDQTTS